MEHNIIVNSSIQLDNIILTPRCVGLTFEDVDKVTYPGSTVIIGGTSRKRESLLSNVIQEKFSWFGQVSRHCDRPQCSTGIILEGQHTLLGNSYTTGPDGNS